MGTMVLLTFGCSYLLRTSYLKTYKSFSFLPSVSDGSVTSKTTSIWPRIIDIFLQSGRAFNCTQLMGMHYLYTQIYLFSFTSANKLAKRLSTFNSTQLMRYSSFIDSIFFLFTLISANKLAERLLTFLMVLTYFLMATTTEGLYISLIAVT